MPDIMHLLEIQTTAEWLYQALTSAEGIRHWWTRDADLDSWVGGFGEFRFYYEGAVVTRVRIEELHPDRRVVWETVSSFRPEWVGTRIEFDLRPSPNSMVLAFAHRGFQHADDVFAVTTTGWAYYLISLQQYLETGHGAPSPDIDFARIIPKERSRAAST
jgi:uncharacterized protein YndB with AHSA1/START domain